MLQLQYYNHKLSKNHIEKILTNYNIKYNTMKNEIDSKINSFIKLCVNDIRLFLENIEEISNERKKIKEAESIKLQFAILKAQLEEKILNEQKMQSEINTLAKENLLLKAKIKTNANVGKPKPKFNYDNFNANSSLLTKYRNKKLGTESNPQLRDKFRDKIKKKIKGKNHQHNLSCSFEKKSPKNIDNIKHSGSMTRRSNNSQEKRVITGYKDLNIKSSNNKNKKNINFQRTPANNKTKMYNTTINKKVLIRKNKKDNKIENTNNTEEQNNSFEGKPFEESLDEDDSITVDDVINEEIRELEIDEKNILSLLDQIKQFKHLKEKQY